MSHSKNIVTDEKKALHPYVNHGNVLMKPSHLESFPSSINELVGYRRITPKSGINSVGAITQSQTVDILIDGDNGGHPHSIYAEVKLRELGNSNNATVLSELIFERIEVYANGITELFHTILPEELGFINYLSIPYDELRRIRQSLALNSDYTPIAGNLPQNGTKIYYIEIPLFKGSQVDFRNIKGGVTFKFIFNAPSIFCDNTSPLSTNVGLSDINIIMKQLNIMNVKPMKTLRHKYINYIRNGLPISNMTASQQYDIPLTSLSGYCSHLIIMIRTQNPATNYNNYKTFLGNIDNIEFHDSANQRLAIPFTQQIINQVLETNLNSDFIYSYPTGTNVYILPFNMVPSSASHGVFYGNYKLTTLEHILITTNSSFATNNVIVDVWGAMMSYYDIEPCGTFKFIKQ